MARERKYTLKKEAFEAEKARKQRKPSPKHVKKSVRQSNRKSDAKRNRRAKTPTPTPTTSATTSPRPTTVEPSNEAINAAAAILIVLEKEYELQTFVYLDKECVSSTHEFLKLGAFNFQAFLAESIKTMAHRTQSSENSVQWT